MQRTQIGIVGAGPAGLLIGNLLLQAGIDCIIVEQHTRDYVEHRARAGVLEDWLARFLEHHGLGERLMREGSPHVACEFRYQQQRFRVPYGSLYDDHAHYVYPQQELVKDLIAIYIQYGGVIRFETPALGFSGLDSLQPVIHTTSEDIHCDFIAGCDGFYGNTRPAIPSNALQSYEKAHEFSWLAILAEAAPSTREIIYAIHERGFAGHMLRTATVSRYYLQCPANDSVENWPDERVWEELDTRLAIAEPWSLTRGPIIEKRVLDLRSFVSDPMQYGRVFLVGDAAHIISPAGAKGMNLACADAVLFVNGVRAFYEEKHTELLATYSERCLQRVWRAQEFSHWLLHLIHMPNPGPDTAFLHHLQLARLQRLQDSRRAAASFAEDYIGSDLLV